MQIAVYGSGGLGGYYGARLAQAGHDVGFIARGAQLRAMREHGLQVLSGIGDIHLHNPKVSDTASDIGPVDVVIVAVKTWQLPEAARNMNALLKADTSVIPFLNGVEAADQLAEALGGPRVLGGLSKVFSLIEAPGVIRHLSPGAEVEIGELSGGVSQRAQSLRELFAGAGIEAQVCDDIRSSLWRKLLMVSSWSGLGALARSPIDVMRSRAGSRELIDAAMDEGIAVGHALGYAVDASFKQQLWTFYDSLPQGTTSSMLRDIVAGKPSELDAWNGAVVRFAAEVGVPAPVHRLVYELLCPMERRARGESELGES